MVTEIKLPASLETIAEELTKRDASMYTPVSEIRREPSDKGGKIVYKSLNYRTNVGDSVILSIGKLFMSSSSEEFVFQYNLTIFNDNSGESHARDQSKLKEVYDAVHQKVSTDPTRSEQERKFLSEFWR